MLPITTHRLLLRPLARDDGARIEAILSDFAVTKTLAVVPHPYRTGGGDAFVADVLAGRKPYRPAAAIVPAGADDLIGVITLRPTPASDRLGYYLAPEWWGRGYASEAVGAMVDAAFATAPERRVIEAGVHADNPASSRVLEKCGFKASATGFEPGLARGGDVASIIYRLTRTEWEARNT